jgi:phosphatidylserine synthase
MVSTIRFRSVKAIDMGWRRSYLALFLAAVALALVASHPQLALVIMSYSYVAFACLMWGLSKLGKRHGGEEGRLEEVPDRYLE